MPDPEPRNRNESAGTVRGALVQIGSLNGDLRLSNRRGLVFYFALLALAAAVTSLILALRPAGRATFPIDAARPPASGTPAPADSATFELTIRRDTGADVDAGETQGRQADGAIGPLDLHLSEFALLTSSGDGFYADSGPESGAAARCREAAANQSPTTQVIPSLVGAQYCFVTSDGRLAWLRVKQSSIASFDDSARLTLAVRVWPA